MSGSLAVAGQRITASWLNQNIPGPWQAVTGQNGWASHGAGSAAFQCRQFNSVTLELIGMLNPGTVAINTVMGSIPAGLPLPVSTQSGWGTILAGTGQGSAFSIVILSSGAIGLGETITGATEVGLHFYISLDA